MQNKVCMIFEFEDARHLAADTDSLTTSRELAAQVVGSGMAGEQRARMEQYLRSSAAPEDNGARLAELPFTWRNWRHRRRKLSAFAPQRRQQQRPSRPSAQVDRIKITTLIIAKENSIASTRQRALATNSMHQFARLSFVIILFALSLTESVSLASDVRSASLGREPASLSLQWSSNEQTPPTSVERILAVIKMRRQLNWMDSDAVEAAADIAAWQRSEKADIALQHNKQQWQAASDDEEAMSIEELDSHTNGVKWALTCAYVIIFVIGVIGNVCNCLVIADSRNRYMKTATNYYLFSLSVSDLLLLIFGVPHDLVDLWHPVPYLFNKFVCIARGWISEASTNASVLVIVAFTIERYLAICHPLRAHTMSRLSRSVNIIKLIWLVASSCALIVVMQFGIVTLKVSERVDLSLPASPLHSNTTRSFERCGPLAQNALVFELSTLVFFIVPMAVISLLYMRLGYHLFEKTTTISKSRQAHEKDLNTHSILLMGEPASAHDNHSASQQHQTLVLGERVPTERTSSSHSRTTTTTTPPPPPPPSSLDYKLTQSVSAERDINADALECSSASRAKRAHPCAARLPNEPSANGQLGARHKNSRQSLATSSNDEPEPELDTCARAVNGTDRNQKLPDVGARRKLADPLKSHPLAAQLDAVHHHDNRDKLTFREAEIADSAECAAAAAAAEEQVQATATTTTTTTTKAISQPSSRKCSPISPTTPDQDAKVGPAAAAGPTLADDSSSLGRTQLQLDHQKTGQLAIKDSLDAQRESPNCVKQHLLFAPQLSASKLSLSCSSSQLGQPQHHQSTSSAKVALNSTVNASNMKSVIKMLVSVVVMFFICWAPFHAQRLMATYVSNPTDQQRFIFSLLTDISGISYYISAVANPILYSLFSMKFRMAFRDTFSSTLAMFAPCSCSSPAPATASNAMGSCDGSSSRRSKRRR